jgi:precorrin-3B C17-methyltransferase
MNRLYIVSTGAGGTKYLTQEALQAIQEAEVIVSYTKYAKELSDMFGDKEVITSGMTKEIERCNIAIDSAHAGKTTALISNGDVNVFAMATLVVEIMDTKELWDDIDVVSIAGVTSILATASRIGAPISQDFAVISLSDRLTPIETIDNRIKCALDGDFVIGIYNPISKKRKRPYEILIEHLQNYSNRVAIIASNIGREDETITVVDTNELIEKSIENELLSMSTMILIGNSSTRMTKNGKVLTPRGYLNKYDLDGEIKNS